jgi:hypothetical protein
MNILLFLLTIFVSFIIVRIGAIIFELTGLEWSIAKFQALSCFTGTGFTTREAELITGHPKRRKVATYLMILGHVGFVTMIATFANSLRPAGFMMNLKIPYLHHVFPVQILPWINFIIVIVGIYLLFRLLVQSRVGRRLTKFLRARIVKRKIIKKVSFEELTIATGGYGISNVVVDKGNPLLDRVIAKTDLTRRGIVILAIERKGEMTATPPANTKIELDDRLVCFGKLDTIRELVHSKVEDESIIASDA